MPPVVVEPSGSVEVSSGVLGGLVVVLGSSYGVVLDGGVEVVPPGVVLGCPCGVVVSLGTVVLG